jgi:sugar transferase (PEP-CTERM/EpsH1 system associated)
VEPLLFLSHRIPFPPNKGDKVRSYHLLKHLAARHRVYLGTFVDDPADWRHRDALQQLCAGSFAAAIAPGLTRLRSLGGLATGESLTLRYYHNRALREWVAATVREQRISRALVFSSAMAQYVDGLPGVRFVLDLVDVDSAKWGEYASRRAWPLSWIYGREEAKLLAVERSAAARADATLLVTAAEAQLFGRLAPDVASRVHVIPNGVDTSFFSPDRTLRSPFAPGERNIVFTGAMDYWPNVDAVCWFAREALPLIRAREPAARFTIVGMNPAPRVRALTRDPAVLVTGQVDDIRPYLQHANVVVAPLRVARGIQNKVLEAMAMARPVVVSTASANALTARAGIELEVAASASEFAERTIGLLAGARAGEMGRAARKRVLQDYEWERNLRQLDALLAGDHASRAETGPATNAAPIRRSASA